MTSCVAKDHIMEKSCSLHYGSAEFMETVPDERIVASIRDPSPVLSHRRGDSAIEVTPSNAFGDTGAFLA